MGTHVRIAELPLCDICIALGADTPERARYDAASRQGSWAYMCERHFESNAASRELGTGRGQWLVLPTEQLPEDMQRQEDQAAQYVELDEATDDGVLVAELDFDGKVAAIVDFLGVTDDEARAFLEDAGEE